MNEIRLDASLFFTLTEPTLALNNWFFRRVRLIFYIIISHFGRCVPYYCYFHYFDKIRFASCGRRKGATTTTITTREAEKRKSEMKCVEREATIQRLHSSPLFVWHTKYSDLILLWSLQDSLSISSLPRYLSLSLAFSEYAEFGKRDKIARRIH